MGVDIIQSMRTLCFGGSFNPIHNAHLACSGAAAKEAGFGRVVLIPSHQPVLKSRSYDLAPAEHRLAMLMLAVRDYRYPGISYDIDPRELERDGPSYTIDTANDLLSNGWRDVHWLIGADQVLHLHKWHRFEELMRTVQFVVMARPGYSIDWNAVHPLAQPLRGKVVTVPQLPISATDIRERIRRGDPVDKLVPANVREYILAHKLYIP